MNPEPLAGYVWLDAPGKVLHVWPTTWNSGMVRVDRNTYPLFHQGLGTLSTAPNHLGIAGCQS